MAVVDDVISAGSSVRATIAALADAGASIAAAGALLVLGDAALAHFALKRAARCSLYPGMYDSEHDRRNRPGLGAGAGQGGRRAAGAVPGKATLVGAMPGMALPAGLRARLDHALSTDLSAVRVGVDPRVAAMGAKAVASGTNVMFAPGSYHPDSPDGQELIAHEIIHLTQQVDRAVAPTRTAGELAINDDPHHEREADDLAARALRGEVVRTGGPAPRDADAPLQGFFDDFGKLGELFDRAVETVSHAVKKVLDPILPEDHSGSFELQRILESDDIELVGAAYDALVEAQRVRAEGQPNDIVCFSGGGKDYELDVAATVTNAMIPALHTRRDQLAKLPVDEKWLDLEAGFNAEFRSIVHAFDLDPVRDDLSTRNINAARLQYLFTADQRDKLLDYFATNLIPERLFDGDEVGRATAQQRILIASKILADGKYRPGSWTQEVHARACFHWARIVYQYAGVTTEAQSTKQGIVGQFDLFGGVLLSDGDIHELFHAKRDDELDPSADHLGKNPNAYRFGNASWDKVQQLQPGDWIYIYNGNKSSSGAHSVIFNGWAGPEAIDADRHLPYRAANVFGQGTPKAGGNASVVILGADLFPVTTGGTAHPVNEIFRVDPDAAPITDVDQLSPEAADSAGTPNEKFEKKLERKYGRKFDRDKFVDWIQAANTWFIDQIDAREGRLTGGQWNLLVDANTSEKVAELICLHQRLYGLYHNSEALAGNTERFYSEEKGAERAADEQEYAAKSLELRARIALREVELASIWLDTQPLHDQIDELEEGELIKQLNAGLKRCRQEVKHLAGAEKKAKIDYIYDLLERLKAAKHERASHKAEIRKLEDELAPYEKREKKLKHEIDALERELGKLVPSDVFGIVHTSSNKGQVKGTVIDGRYEHIPGKPPWKDFLGDPL